MIKRVINPSPMNHDCLYDRKHGVFVNMLFVRLQSFWLSKPQYWGQLRNQTVEDWEGSLSNKSKLTHAWCFNRTSGFHCCTELNLKFEIMHFGTINAYVNRGSGVRWTIIKQMYINQHDVWRLSWWQISHKYDFTTKSP